MTLSKYFPSIFGPQDRLDRAKLPSLQLEPQHVPMPSVLSVDTPYTDQLEVQRQLAAQQAVQGPLLPYPHHQPGPLLPPNPRFANPTTPVNDHSRIMPNALTSMLISRLGEIQIPFKALHAAQNQHTVLVFVVTDTDYVVLKDDPTWFPSDDLVCRIRLLI